MTLMVDNKYFAVLEQQALEALRSAAIRLPGRPPNPTDTPGFEVSMNDKLLMEMMRRNWVSREILLARCFEQPMTSVMTCSCCCSQSDWTKTKAPMMLMAATKQTMAGKVRMMCWMVRGLCNLRMKFLR